jgi:hypothetical protein
MCVLDLKASLGSRHISLTPRPNRDHVPYLLLCNACCMLVCNAHWACLLNVNSVAATVYSPTATMSEALN